MDRRRFLLTSLAGALGAPLAAGAQQARKVWQIGYLAAGNRSENLTYLNSFRQGLRDLGYTWTPALDTLQGAAERLAKVVEEMSGGRFRIEVFPGGQIMPPLDCFEGASRGTIEAFMGVPSYWATKEPALSWFYTVPFGMNPEGTAAWYYQGDGLRLMEESYAAFNIVPRPGPAAAPQMAGWFRKKMSAIGDYKGLKMRIGTVFGGKVYVKAGGTAVLTPGADIYAALERGVIDACEWVGPHDDMKLGLHKTARYYYYPGWQEPGA